MNAADRARQWPALDYPAWRETVATLQLWTQIVGKVRLSLTPWLNHSWHVPLYVNGARPGHSPIRPAAACSRSSSISSSIAWSAQQRGRR